MMRSMLFSAAIAVLLSANGAEAVRSVLYPADWKPGFADELKANFDNEEYIRTFLGSCFYEKPSPELLETMWKYTRTADPEAAYTVSRSLREVDYREALKAYKNPALIIHGALDTRRKMDSVAMIQQSLPQAETVLLQTGHTPMAEDVKGYGEALNRFLREKLMLQLFLSHGIIYIDC